MCYGIFVTGRSLLVATIAWQQLAPVFRQIEAIKRKRISPLATAAVYALPNEIWERIERDLDQAGRVTALAQILGEIMCDQCDAARDVEQNPWTWDDLERQMSEHCDCELNKTHYDGFDQQERLQVSLLIGAEGGPPAYPCFCRSAEACSSATSSCSLASTRSVLLDNLSGGAALCGQTRPTSFASRQRRIGVKAQVGSGPTSTSGLPKRTLEARRTTLTYASRTVRIGVLNESFKSKICSSKVVHKARSAALRIPRPATAHRPVLSRGRRSSRTSGQSGTSSSERLTELPEPACRVSMKFSRSSAIVTPRLSLSVKSSESLGRTGQKIISPEMGHWGSGA